jgi:hypothetical protein
MHVTCDLDPESLSEVPINTYVFLQNLNPYYSILILLGLLSINNNMAMEIFWGGAPPPLTQGNSPLPLQTPDTAASSPWRRIQRTHQDPN